LKIADVLVHAAGLPEYCGDDFAPSTRSDLLTRCLAQPLLFVPGTSFKYSNVGYALLAAIVEEASHEDLDAYLNQRFFAPAGIGPAGYELMGVSHSLLAEGYVKDSSRGFMLDRVRELHGAYWNLKGNGGMEMSADDMSRWFNAVAAGAEPIGQSMRDAMFRPRLQRDSVNFGTYGFTVKNLPERKRVFSHSGSDGVFFSALAIIPEERLVIYTVSNSGENPMTRGILSYAVRMLRQP
jgi:CubicO group peptidase (beta-lactamase class C family)